MTQEEAKQLLQKYLDGNTNQSETDLVETWYSILPTNQPLSPERKKGIAENMRSNIENALGKETRKKKLVSYSWIKIAALLFIILSFGLVLWKTQYSNVAAENWLTVSTRANQRKQVTLPDGSTVILEANAKIAYPNTFASQLRNVKLLEGNAFFSVVHDENRTFKVQLKSKMEVVVLGTSFRIRDNQKEHEVKISVATGKVAVKKGLKKLATLIKGQELVIHRLSGQAKIGKATHSNIVKLSFDGNSLAEVIQKMQYIYSIKILVDQPRYLNLKCTADFNSGQQPAEILDILCRLHHLQFTESADHQTFKISK